MPDLKPKNRDSFFHEDINMYFIIFSLILFLPVIITDFLVSGGFVPISYLIFSGMIFYPFFIPLCIVYICIFYGIALFLSILLSEKPKIFYSVSVLIFGFLVVLSLNPVYMEIGHNASENKDLYTLFVDRFDIWKAEIAKFSKK